MNFLDRPRDISAVIVPQLDESKRKRVAEQPPRDYLGASAIGHPCQRSVAYGWRDRAKARDFPGRIGRIFDIGHEVERLVIEDMRAAGWVIETGPDPENPKSQFGFEEAFRNGTFAGHCDGIVHAAPPGVAVYGFPRLLEVKSANDDRWSAMKSEGLRRTEPAYYHQVAAYSGLITARGDLRQHPALFVAENKNDCELTFEEIPHDEVALARVLALASEILDKGRPPATFDRGYNDVSDWHCRPTADGTVMCPHWEECWSTARPKVVPIMLEDLAAAPDWY